MSARKDVCFGREILVLSIHDGLDPYGFIGKFHAFNPLDSVEFGVRLAGDALIVSERSSRAAASGAQKLHLDE